MRRTLARCPAYRTTLGLLVMVSTVFALPGCGGGGNGLSAAGSRSGRAAITVTWPSRSRLIPLASNSIKIDIKQGALVVGSKTVARPADGISTTVTIDPLPTGDLTAIATAYPQADGTGIAQAAGTVPLHVNSGQTATFTLTLGSTVSSLSLTPAASTIPSGGTTHIDLTARDSGGNVVLISPSKVRWEALNPTIASVDADGNIHGLTAGQAGFKATETESGVSGQCVITVSGLGDLIIYDGFDYTSGQGLAELAGGTGWSNQWDDIGQGSTPTVINDGSLTFGNLLTIGNASLSTSDLPVGNHRAFANQMGQSGSVVYASFLMKPLDDMNAGRPDTYFGMVIGSIFVGKGGPSQFYGVEDSGGGNAGLTNVTAVPGETVFIVLRITFQEGPDKVELWVNPTPGQPLSAPNAVKQDRDLGMPVEMNTGASIRCIWDEIRFGKSWESVSPTQPAG
jgi:hypothetical protein